MSHPQNDKFNDGFIDWWENQKPESKPNGLMWGDEFWSDNELFDFSSSIQQNSNFT